MRFLKYIVIMILSITLTFTAANAQSFQDANTAYDNQDYKTAFEINKKFAEKGDLAAQMNLAHMFDEGLGTARNSLEADKWHIKAAKHGDPLQQNFLGIRYYEGKGTIQNYVEAYKWLNLAVSNSNLKDDIVRNSKIRDEIAQKMTPAQIAQAQEMALLCKQSNYRNCE